MKWISTVVVVVGCVLLLQVGCQEQIKAASGELSAEQPAARRDITKDFFVELPRKVRPIPEPLAKGQKPGFRIRGIKGWCWTQEQYLTEIPILAKYKMNFLMNCYGSMFSPGPPTAAFFGMPLVNQWWRPIPEPKKQAYEKVIRECQKYGIQFCFSLHPQLNSPRPLDLTSSKDFEDFWQHFAWAQNLGVKWFSVCIDDVRGIPIDGVEHSRFLNKILKRLHTKDPQAQLIFGPTWYWGDGTSPKYRPYLEALARELHPDVYVFWTGSSVVPPHITCRCAESYKSIVKHRIIIWDNYPVNDNHPTMHLGPVTGREPGLCDIVDGYISNPLCTQNQINRIPLLTCADYAYNPKAYDPARSIGQAIAHLADTDQQRAVLKDLVEAYPGMLIYESKAKCSTKLNPVRERFDQLTAMPHSRFVVGSYIHYLEKLSARLSRSFPGQFEPAKKTLADDITWMKRSLAAEYKQ